MIATDRSLILERIGKALADVPQDEQPEDVHVPRDYHVAPAEQPDPLLVELFAERAADYRAHVIRTGSRVLGEVVAELLATRRIGRLVVPPGFPDALPASGAADRQLVRDTPPLSTAQLDIADGVITTVALAIAQTGTILLDAGPGQGRRALTLLPDYHLCVVRAEQIVPDVPTAMRRLDPRRPLTMISGPSATSDIENNRVEGVHGPRTLDIVIVETDPAETEGDLR